MISCLVGQQFIGRIREIKGHIYPGRWGTVSFSVPELLAIEPIIRWGWDREKFMLGESEDQGAARDAIGAMAETVDEAA